MSDEDIAKDYNLTEIGLEPLMPALMARFQKEPMFRDNWDAALKMGSAKYVSYLNFHPLPSPCLPLKRVFKLSVALTNYFTVAYVHRPETILKTLSILQEKYGSVDRYLKTKTSLTDEDLVSIKKGLLVEA